MTLDQLEAFMTVVQYGTFSKAADKLFLTQTALGHRISNLEKELGVVLMLRNRGIAQITLTSEGNRFAEIAQQIIDLWQQALNINKTVGRKNISLSCGASLYNLFVPLVLKRLIENDFRPNAASSNTKVALYSIKEGDIDFAINCHDIDAGSDNYYVDEIADEEMVMMSHQDTAYGEKISVKELDFDKCFVIIWNAAFVNWCKKMFSNYDAHTAFFENVSLVERAMHDDRWAIVPITVADYYINKGFPFKKSIIEETVPARRICLISRKPLPPGHDVVLQAMRDVLSEVDGVQLLNIE